MRQHMPVFLSRAFITLLEALWNHSYNTDSRYSLTVGNQNNISISSIITSPFSIYIMFATCFCWDSSFLFLITARGRKVVSTYSIWQLRFSTG